MFARKFTLRLHGYAQLVEKNLQKSFDKSQILGTDVAFKYQ